MSTIKVIMSGVVLLLSIYSISKFAFFFLLPYDQRRQALDKSYAGRAYASGKGDTLLLGIAAALGASLLLIGAEPIALLGGVFVGATLIQMFFHAFHQDPPTARQAPEPLSPLKRLSYAIQDQPARAGLHMAIYTIIVLAAIAAYFLR